MISRLPNIGSIITNVPTQIFLPSVKSSVHEQAEMFRSFRHHGCPNAVARTGDPEAGLPACPSIGDTTGEHADARCADHAINEATIQEAKREQLAEYSHAGGPDWQLDFST